MDKLDKIGHQGVIDELTARGFSSDAIDLLSTKRTIITLLRILKGQISLLNKLNITIRHFNLEPLILLN